MSGWTYQLNPSKSNWKMCFLWTIDIQQRWHLPDWVAWVKSSMYKTMTWQNAKNDVNVTMIPKPWKQKFWQWIFKSSIKKMYLHLLFIMSALCIQKFETK